MNYNAYSIQTGMNKNDTHNQKDIKQLNIKKYANVSPRIFHDNR